MTRQMKFGLYAPEPIPTCFNNRTNPQNLTQDKTLRRYMGIDKQMEKEAMKKAFGKL